VLRLVGVVYSALCIGLRLTIAPPWLSALDMIFQSSDAFRWLC